MGSIHCVRKCRCLAEDLLPCRSVAAMWKKVTAMKLLLCAGVEFVAMRRHRSHHQVLAPKLSSCMGE